MDYKDRYLPKVLASSKTANSSSPVISFLAFSLFAGCDALLCFAGGDENGSLCSSTTFSFFGLEDRLRLSFIITSPQVGAAQASQEVVHSLHCLQSGGLGTWISVNRDSEQVLGKEFWESRADTQSVLGGF